MSVAALNEADAIILLGSVDIAVGLSFVNNCIGGVGKLLSDSLFRFSDLGKLAACDDDAVLVDDTDGSSDNVLHLVKQGLIQAV